LKNSSEARLLMGKTLELSRKVQKLFFHPKVIFYLIQKFFFSFPNHKTLKISDGGRMFIQTFFCFEARIIFKILFFPQNLISTVYF
jgi:hypothetical protein